MERDFLGLSNKQPLFQLKEEIDDIGLKESGCSKSSAVQWNKFYASPNFMSCRVSQAAEIQDVKAFPAAYQTTAVSAANVLLSNRFGRLAQNSVAATNRKPLLLGGIPITSPSSHLPTLNSFAGFMDPRNSAASSGSPPQLTIFYAGTVNVIDDISPEKAQAIMLWAGNGSSLASIMENRKVQDEETYSKPVGLNTFPDAAGVSSPVSVSSSSGAHSESVSMGVDKPVTTKSMNVVGSFCAAANMIPSVPQARKASLARFLEKRKERLLNSMPYTSKKKLLDCSNGESSGMSFSATSAA